MRRRLHAPVLRPGTPDRYDALCGQGNPAGYSLSFEDVSCHRCGLLLRPATRPAVVHQLVHPGTRGLCARAEADEEQVSDPERVTCPRCRVRAAHRVMWSV